MTHKPNFGLRKVAALAATVVVGAGLSVVATPATAATGTLNYTCAVTKPLPVEGLKFTATADTNAPAQLAVGKANTPTLTAKITIDEGTTGLLRDLAGGEQVEGTGTFDALVNGVKQTRPATIAKTAAPASGPMTVSAVAKLNPVKPAKVGNIAIQARDFTAQLKLSKNDGTPAAISDVDIACVQDAGQAAASTVDTIKVVKANSKTTVKASWKAKSKTLTATATVTPKSTGKVVFTVKKNNKLFKTLTVKLNGKSQAAAKLAKLGKGTYAISAKYTGSANGNASTSKTVTKKV